MGQTLMFSILPPLAREMGLSELQVASIFATNAAAWVVFSPIWGRKSDQWGRRPVILIGFMGYAVSLIALALVTQMGLSKIWPLSVVYPLMVLSRVIFGVIGSGTAPASQAYVADRTSRGERANAMAKFAGAFGLGAMMGPALGGMLVTYGYLTPIYAVAGLSVLSGLLIWLFLPERTDPNATGPKPRINPMAPELRPFLIAGILSGVTMAVAQQTLGFYLMDVIGLTAQAAARQGGVALMVSAGTALFTQLVLIQRIKAGPGTLMKIGFWSIIASFVLLVMVPQFSALLIAMSGVGLGVGLVLPSISAAASLSVSQDKQGATAGLVTSSRAVGHIVGPIAGLSLYQYWVLGPYVMVLGLLALFSIYAAFTPHMQIMAEEAVMPVEGEL